MDLKECPSFLGIAILSAVQSFHLITRYDNLYMIIILEILLILLCLFELVAKRNGVFLEEIVDIW